MTEEQLQAQIDLVNAQINAFDAQAIVIAKQQAIQLEALNKRLSDLQAKMAKIKA